MLKVDATVVQWELKSRPALVAWSRTKGAELLKGRMWLFDDGGASAECVANRTYAASQGILMWGGSQKECAEIMYLLGRGKELCVPLSPSKAEQCWEATKGTLFGMACRVGKGRKRHIKGFCGKKDICSTIFRVGRWSAAKTEHTYIFGFCCFSFSLLMVHSSSSTSGPAQINPLAKNVLQNEFGGGAGAGETRRRW